MSNFILQVFLCLLLLVTWESGLDKASTEIQGLSSTDCNFQTFKVLNTYFKIQGLSTIFKVRANPGYKYYEIGRVFFHWLLIART